MLSTFYFALICLPFKKNTLTWSFLLLFATYGFHNLRKGIKTITHLNMLFGVEFLI